MSRGFTFAVANLLGFAFQRRYEYGTHKPFATAVWAPLSSRTSQHTRQQLEVQAPSSCSLSGTAKTICQARVNQYCCSDPVGNAFHESNGWWMTNSISSCVGLARKRRKPRKARKGNESAEANTRSEEARGSTRKRQMISSQFGLLILITAQLGVGICFLAPFCCQQWHVPMSSWRGAHQLQLVVVRPVFGWGLRNGRTADPRRFRMLWMYVERAREENAQLQD